VCGRAIDQSQHGGAVCSVVTAAAACVAGDEVMRPRWDADCSRHGA